MPRGTASMTTTRTRPKTAAGGCPRALRERAMSRCVGQRVASAGSATSRSAPQTAPARLPRPPITMAITRNSDSDSGKAPGETLWASTANRAPPRPAQAALTTNATTLVRARRSRPAGRRPRRRGRPASRARTGPDEVGEQEHREQRRGRRSTPASARTGTSPEAAGRLDDDRQALVAVERARRRSWRSPARRRHREGQPGQIGPVQPGAGQPDDATDDRGDDDRGEERDEEQQRPVVPAGRAVRRPARRVGAGRHQRAVAERELPGEPGRGRSARRSRRGRRRPWPADSCGTAAAVGQHEQRRRRRRAHERGAAAACLARQDRSRAIVRRSSPPIGRRARRAAEQTPTSRTRTAMGATVAPR